MFYRFARFVVSIWLRLWYKVIYLKDPSQDQAKGFIVAANHQSNLDPVVLAIGMKQQVHYMAKVELFEKPFLGTILRWLGQFPVQRGRGDTGAIDFSISIIESGDVLGIFPEGTRSMDGRLLRPKSGAALIAGKTGAKILPAGITYENKGKFRSKVTVKYGKMIESTELGVSSAPHPKELKAASKLIMERIGQLVDYHFDDEPADKAKTDQPIDKGDL